LHKVKLSSQFESTSGVAPLHRVGCAEASDVVSSEDVERAAQPRDGPGCDLNADAGIEVMEIVPDPVALLSKVDHATTYRFARRRHVVEISNRSQGDGLERLEDVRLEGRLRACELGLAMHGLGDTEVGDVNDFVPGQVVAIGGGALVCYHGKSALHGCD